MPGAGVRAYNRPMTPRGLLASLIAMLLIAAASTGAETRAGGGADCAIAVSAGTPHGCCAWPDMPGCASACAVPAAAVGQAADQSVFAARWAPNAGCGSPARIDSRPPDTAPPKRFSA
jgi:hypothetical protein